SGILLQLPVPDHLDGPTLTEMIPPEKDVDGLTPVNTGLLSLGRPGLRPCTPLGVMELLEQSGVHLEGTEAVVVGRSNLFGKAMRLGRVRAGELVALTGAALIVVSLFERWYEGPAGTLDAWDTFGPAVVLLLLAAITAVALFAVNVAERAPVIPVVVEVAA